MPGIKDLPYAERAAATERARRIARFKRAMERARKIVNGEPRLTDAELAELAGVFTSRASGGEAGTAA